MDKELKRKILELYPEFRTIYGPYQRKDGRNIVILYDGKKRSARQYAKVILEVKIGRRLVGDETVDHIDENFQNDDPNNLRILSLSQNTYVSKLKVKPKVISCCWCNTPVTVKYENKGSDHKAGPFCSKSCVGHYGKHIQSGGAEWDRVKVGNEYYK